MKEAILQMDKKKILIEKRRDHEPEVDSDYEPEVDSDQEQEIENDRELEVCHPNHVQRIFREMNCNIKKRDFEPAFDL